MASADAVSKRPGARASRSRRSGRPATRALGLAFAWSLAWGGISFSAGDQFRPDEIAARARWEGLLKTAKIADTAPMEGPTATTRPHRLSLENDGVLFAGLWKYVDNALGGVPDRWRYEIAAYRLDILLDLEMIPPTVEKRVGAEKGSLQLWVDDTSTLKTLTSQGASVPADNAEAWNRMAYLQRAFDCLIANEDRNANNILVTGDWRMILVDHSRSFRTAREFTEQLIFGAAGRMRGPDGNPILYQRLPRAFVEKLRALDAPAIKQAVKPYLNDKEIASVLARNLLVLREIEEAVKASGEAAVLY